MKTAMQELREKLLIVADNEETPMEYAEDCKNIASDIEFNMMEIEKRQIVEHHTFLLSGVMGEEAAREDAEQYYNETFKD